MRSKVYLLVLFLLLIPKVGNATFRVEDSISIVGGLDTNPLYMDTSQARDYFMKVDPKVFFVYGTKELTVRVGGWLDYNKYFQETNQSSVVWGAAGNIEARPGEATKITFSTDYLKNSDPIRLDTESRYEWTSPILKLKMDYRNPGSPWGFTADFEANSKEYDLSSIQNFNNRKKYIGMGGRYYFFPETALLFGARSGYSSYPLGHFAHPYGNTNSVYNEVYTGVEGRISTDITLNFKIGFLWLDYEYGTDFHEPIMKLSFTDLLSSFHSVSVAYERMAYDSTYSNFYVDQELSLESKSIWFDSITNIFTAQYIYRYYRYAPKRIDHRLGFMTEFALPFITMSRINENISFITTFLAEWVSSDAYNTFGLYTGPDPSANYRRFVVLFGLTTKY